MLLPDGRVWKYGGRYGCDSHFVNITAETFTESTGLYIVGNHIQMLDDGSLAIRDQDYRPEPYMNHITWIAKNMRDPDIEEYKEYKRFGIRRVG